MNEYPKALYRGADIEACLADIVTVTDASGEESARKSGYAMYAEIHARKSTPATAAEPAKRPYTRKAK